MQVVVELLLLGTSQDLSEAMPMLALEQIDRVVAALGWTGQPLVVAGYLENSRGRQQEKDYSHDELAEDLMRLAGGDLSSSLLQIRNPQDPVYDTYVVEAEAPRTIADATGAGTVVGSVHHRFGSGEDRLFDLGLDLLRGAVSRVPSCCGRIAAERLLVRTEGDSWFGWWEPEAYPAMFDRLILDRAWALLLEPEQVEALGGIESLGDGRIVEQIEAESGVTFTLIYDQTYPLPDTRFYSGRNRGSGGPVRRRG